MALNRQHLIDPAVCIRCNTCEETCPVDAITHDATNYVVDYDKCKGCMDCIAPCPTGAIDSWQTVATPWTLDDQYSWDDLPDEPEGLEAEEAAPDAEVADLRKEAEAAQGGKVPPPSRQRTLTSTSTPRTIPSPPELPGTSASPGAMPGPIFITSFSISAKPPSRFWKVNVSA